jgi:hypothetical protein
MQDSKEGASLTGTLLSPKTPYPCRMGWIKRADLDNPEAECRPRLQADIVARATECASDIAARHNVGAARKRAQEWSIKPFVNPLWWVPFGCTVFGIFFACPPELLHVFYVGLLMYIKEEVLKLIEHLCTKYRHSPGATKYATARKLLDDRFANFFVDHRDMDMPRQGFRTGKSALFCLRWCYLRWVALIAVN